MGKPTVISNWPQRRQNFDRGFVLAGNTSESIATRVEQMLHERMRPSAEIIAMRSALGTRRQLGFEELKGLL